MGLYLCQNWFTGVEIRYAYSPDVLKMKKYYLKIYVEHAGIINSIKLHGNKSERVSELNTLADKIEAIEEINWKRPDPINLEIGLGNTVQIQWDIDTKDVEAGLKVKEKTMRILKLESVNEFMRKRAGEKKGTS
jgi:hypothetical protein